MAYDVFISYRRETGLDDARLLQQALKARGYKVFFDYDSVRDGKFDEKIYEAIAEAPVFILMLTSGALDRCKEKGDWVREEIETAFAKKRCMVSVVPSNHVWVFPQTLPESLEPVRTIQVSDLHKGSLFEESIDKLVKERFPAQLQRPRQGPTHLERGLNASAWLLCTILFAACLAWGWLEWRSSRRLPVPVPQPEEETVPEPSPTPQEEPARDAEYPEPSEHAAGETIRLQVCDGFVAELAWCPPGTFNMGSPTNETGRGTDEPLHPVRLSRGFWMARYPTTQRQWRLVMGNNPSWFKKGGELSEESRRELAGNPEADNPDHPVEHVSWHECNDFLAKASAMAGCRLRLPTEAEWEYACRAGSSDAYCWGRALNGDLANVDGRLPCASEIEGPYLERTSPVGSYFPNAWGLYDMHGNVFEWTQDFYGEYPEEAVVDPQGPARGATKVVRGGNWCNSAKAARSAARNRCIPSLHNARTGFRFCLDSLPDDLDE